MTEYEYSSMMGFLDKLVHTRTVAKDLTAERRIKQALERQPFSAYFLVQRAMTLEIALSAAQARIKELEGHPASPAAAPQTSEFLGAGAAVWGTGLDEPETPKAHPAATTTTRQEAPRRLTVEDKSIEFIANNARAIWVGIGLLALLAVIFKR
jgi:hypothetical protein